MTKFTSEQQKVIDTRDKNILVSAAAGSGKTAVLVERIIRRVLDKEHPVDVDKLLVVTFTNAAAAQMRERILKAIDKELEKDPNNEHLANQQAYIHNASITTIHSFCLNLIKEHFADVDIDPAVRVADEGEISLMKSDVVSELLETYYAKNDDSFLQFVEQFSTKNSDAYIEQMILDLYEKAMGYPWPDKWLDKCLRNYEYDSPQDFLKSQYIEFIISFTNGVLLEAINEYKMMLEICRDGGPDVYTDRLEMEMESISNALGCNDYEKKKTLLQFSFERLPACKKQDTDENLKNIVMDARNKVKKDIKELNEKYFSRNISQEYEEIKKCSKIIKTYVNLTKDFIGAFKKKKADKNIIDFNDFEHYAIDILVKEENGKVIPTKVADELANYYEEVMIDEYQDSNFVQETILSSVSKERFGIHNRFMVGDVKQSIYGFRGSNPQIFIDKYNTYQLEGKENLKIILDKNFRSRRGVIESTNFIFQAIMNEELGGINYDETNRLYLGANYEEPDTFMDQTEFLMITSPEENEEEEKEQDIENDDSIASSGLEMEAATIAERILKLTNNDTGMMVRDEDSANYRRAKYSDIVILLRSVSGAADVMNDVLSSRGIPVYMESKSGYFKTLEIRTLINYLKIIDNPIQDLPLAAVMKSQIGGFNDEQIAIIRAFGTKEVSLYENLIQYKNENKDGISEQITKFIEQLNEFRMSIHYLTIYDLIQKILIETNYYDFIKAMPSGKRRLANIDMFLDKAATYESGSYKGLFNFIRYMEKMNKYEIEMGEASILSQNDNSVRIMSIHKSKGLEFPIVFVANIGKNFNMMDINKKAIIHGEMGIGIDYVDMDLRVKTKNIIKAVIAKKIQLETVEEEMRLLYVACTRAKEKLIFTYHCAKENKLNDMVFARMNQNAYLGYGVIQKCRQYADFITKPLGRNKCFEKIFERLGIEKPLSNKYYQENSYINVSILSEMSLLEQIVQNQYIEDSEASVLWNMDAKNVYSEKIRQIIRSQLDFVYPYQKETSMNAKMSVSEIKKNGYESEDAKPLLTEMVSDSTKNKQGLTGADRGTAYHRIFELYDFSIEPTTDNIENWLNELEQKAFITNEQRESIKIKDILTFAKSPLGMRMKEAFKNGTLQREAQFVLGLQESEIEAYQNLAKNVSKTGQPTIFEQPKKTGDVVLIQGIIDAYFIENGQVVIVDYKTDHVKDESELIKRYYVQLELYKRAVSQISGLKVQEKIIYALENASQITM